MITDEEIKAKLTPRNFRAWVTSLKSTKCDIWDITDCIGARFYRWCWPNAAHVSYGVERGHVTFTERQRIEAPYWLAFVVKRAMNGLPFTKTWLKQQVKGLK